MLVLLSYCLKLSVSLALVSLFYRFVLRKLTFYNWNRYYLLGYSLLSFFVAFIDISPVLKQTDWNGAHFVQWVPDLNSAEIVTPAAAAPGFLTAWNITGLLLITGIGVMLFRLLFQLFSFHRMIKKAEPLSVEGMRFYQVNDTIIPFSFGRSIFINRHLHTREELQEIIRHEFVHVKQKHSIDIILGEILCLFNWYNPFAWLLKASIRQNLEFIADNKVLENGINKKEYQYLLLKVIGNNQFSIAQKFNFSSLKKRIAMMNKLQSARLNLVRFLFILPLVAVLLLAFRNRSQKNPIVVKSDHAVLPSGTIVSPYKNPVRDTVPKSTRANSSEKNLSVVSDDFEINDERAVIHLKNGTTEEYDLKNKEQRKKFEEKYGKIVATTVHAGPMTTVSVVTAEGVKTAVAPVTVINSNSNKNSNTNSNSNTVSVAASTSVSTSATIVSPANVSSSGTTVIASVHPAVADRVHVITDDGYTVTGKEEILITITKKTTPQQLEEFIKQMKEKGIELKFNNTDYDNGILTHISGMIKFKDSQNSFSATDFNKLVLSRVKDGDRMYLKVDIVEKKQAI